MAAERASVYTTAPERFVLDVAKPVNDAGDAYTGEERRMETRRKGKDRRVDTRFNLTKPDRRETVGRRAEDQLPDFW